MGNEQCVIDYIDQNSCNIGDIDWRSLGRIYWEDLAYLDVDKFGQEDFLLLS